MSPRNTTTAVATMQVARGTGLAKPSAEQKKMARRVEQAQHRFNERYARIWAAYKEDLQRAILDEPEAPTSPAATESAA